MRARTTRAVALVLLAGALLPSCRRESDAPVMPAEPVRTPRPRGSAPGKEPPPGAAQGTAPTAATPGRSASPAPVATARATAAPPVTGPLHAATAAASPAALDERLEKDVRAFVEQWRSAWQSKALEEYLGHYDARFQGDGLDLDGWRARKTDVFSKAGDIRVVVEDLRVRADGGAPSGAARASAPDGGATQPSILVEFTQSYTSGVHTDRGTKTLALVRAPAGGFHIVRETFRKGR